MKKKEQKKHKYKHSNGCVQEDVATEKKGGK